MQHATSDVRNEVARRVKRSTVTAVARALGMPREQIARIAGGLPVRLGTIALARERLAAGSVDAPR
jgi:hypothetical protein